MTDLEKLEKVYNIVREHLLKQNAKSTASPSSAFCRYRGDVGRKCAVGILITDENYNIVLEGKDIRCDEVMLAVLKSLAEEGYKANCVEDLNRLANEIKYKLNKYQTKLRLLLIYLQKIHDNSSVSRWPTLLPANFQEIVQKLPYLALEN